MLDKNNYPYKANIIGIVKNKSLLHTPTLSYTACEKRITAKVRGKSPSVRMHSLHQSTVISLIVAFCCNTNTKRIQRQIAYGDSTRTGLFPPPVKYFFHPQFVCFNTISVSQSCNKYCNRSQVECVTL